MVRSPRTPLIECDVDPDRRRQILDRMGAQIRAKSGLGSEKRGRSNSDENTMHRIS